MLRNKKNEEEMKHIKNKPKMSKLSKKIMEKKKCEIKPIHQRVNEIVDKKYLKVDKLKQIYRDIENSNSSRYSTQFDEKKFEEWLNKQMKWELEKKSKIITVKEENERLETSINRCMYHPSIDKNKEILVTKSKILNSENSSKKSDESVYEKLYNLRDEKYNKLVKRLIESIPDFTPTINKNMPTYLNKNKNDTKSTNFSRYNRNSKKEIDIKKNRQHFKSVEERDIFHVIYEENNENEENDKNGNYEISYKKHKNSGINTSINNNYDNPLKENESDNQDHDLDLIAKYRKALQTNDTNIRPILKNEKKNDSEKVFEMNKIDFFDNIII